MASESTYGLGGQMSFWQSWMFDQWKLMKGLITYLKLFAVYDKPKRSLMYDHIMSDTSKWLEISYREVALPLKSKF